MAWHPYAMRVLGDAVAAHGVRRVLEYGSGSSTAFLERLTVEAGLPLRIVSFDNDPEYSHTTTLVGTTRVLLEPLVCGTREQADEVMRRGEFDLHGWAPFSGNEDLTAPCFYRGGQQAALEWLDGAADLVLLDGPWMGGRPLACVHARPFLRPGTLILVDDEHFLDEPLSDCWRRMYGAQEIDTVSAQYSRLQSFTLLRLPSHATFAT